jgi:hypothetical protein
VGVERHPPQLARARAFAEDVALVVPLRRDRLTLSIGFLTFGLASVGAVAGSPLDASPENVT